MTNQPPRPSYPPGSAINRLTAGRPAVRVPPNLRSALAGAVLTELAAEQQRKEAAELTYQSDIVDWASHNFYVPETLKPILLLPHQKAILRGALTLTQQRRFPYSNFMFSTIKKSGKSTLGGLVGRWMAETQIRYGEEMFIGNDRDQAKDRGFRDIRQSIEISPGYNRNRGVLPGRWNLKTLSFDCLTTGTTIKAISVDAPGEAGGEPAFTCFTELWGFEYSEAIRFWDEMIPIPTLPISLRMVETYAGYDGESSLLQGLYKTGLAGRQLTAGELAAIAQRDRPGESFQDLVNGWHETKGDPSSLIPVWVNEAASMFMYWDSGVNARRMPWQHRPLTDPSDPSSLCETCQQPFAPHISYDWAEKYYQQEEHTEPPAAFRRLHFNEWVGAESAFVPMELWDACRATDGHIPEFLVPGSLPSTGLVAAADAATTGDCFGIVVGRKCPLDPDESVDILAVKLWDPKEEGGLIEYVKPESFLRFLAKGGCSLGHWQGREEFTDPFCPACQTQDLVPGFNLSQITYDPYQLESLSQNMRREQIAWMDPFNQMGDRLKADKGLYDAIIRRKIHHNGNLLLRQHIQNCNAKMAKDEDNRLRLVKKKSGGKIDLAVATSMMRARVLYLLLPA